MAMSHANCKHAATPAGRRECRSLGGPVAWAAANSAAINKPTGMPEPKISGFMTDEIKMTGPVARRMARQAARADAVRIQPRRSGARVSVANSGCVQAALHIDAHGGRCACGWNAVAA